MILLRWLTFLLRFLTLNLTVLLFWISSFLLTLVFVLQWLYFHLEILIMSFRTDALFHGIAYDYSRADWDGLRDHLIDVHGWIQVGIYT